MDVQYRISFYRTILNDVGRHFRCRLDCMNVRSARSKERAVEAAKHRFARRRNISSWDRLAEEFEVEELARAPAQNGGTGRSGKSSARARSAHDEKSVE